MQKTTVQHPFARPKPIPPKPTVGWSPGPFDCVTSRTIQPNVARCRHGNIIWEGCDTSGHRGRRNLKVFLGHHLGRAPRPSGPGDTHILVCHARSGIREHPDLGTLTFLLGQTMSVPRQRGPEFGDTHNLFSQTMGVPGYGLLATEKIWSQDLTCSDVTHTMWCIACFTKEDADEDRE